jgi:DNA-binding transcriptional ArsR family regulator
VDSLSTTLAAVADPTRRAILRRLRVGPATVGQLAEPFDFTQQAISKHLACLERAQLIRKRREGRTHICSLDPAPLEEVAAWTEQFREFWEESFDRLDDVLDKLQSKEKKRDRKN